MRCDELRQQMLDGAPADAAAHEHIASCPECRDEFGFIITLRRAHPEPSASLRERVLAGPRRRFRWSVAGVAASIALALGAGFAGGRVLPQPPRVEVRTVVVQKPMDDREVFCTALALLSVYKGQVDCEFDGMTCRRIKADRDVMKMLPYCPVVQNMDRVMRERPELVVLR